MTFRNLPHEMQIYNQWIVWRFEETTNEKPTKIPYSPLSDEKAGVNYPNTWGSFENALNAMNSGRYDGIGFVLTENDPYAFIDLDDTKGDQTAMDRQLKIFNEFDGYAERSPSGKGLHIITKGALPSGRKRSNIEIYSSGRYMTMTGDVYRQEPIKEHTELLNVLWKQMSQGREASVIYGNSQKEKLTDDEVLQMAQNAENRDKFITLLEGNWQSLYSSQSEADFAFINIISFYSRNEEQIKRIFKASKLGERDKKTTIRGIDYVSYMVNRSFDNMLPPIDIEGLKAQLNDSIKAKAEENEIEAKSLNDRFEPEQTTTEEDVDLQFSSNVYSVPPGLVGDIAQFIYAQAPRPVPEIALAGALGMMAGIVGRAYNVSGTGLNQYMLLLAPTGTGKEAIASGIDKLFESVIRTVPAASDFIGPGEIASSQAIIKYMSKGPNSFVSLVGEFGIYLQGMASVNAPPHLMGLRRFLLDAYNKSGEGKVLRPSIYSDKDKNTTSVISPAFSILGESTPEKFYEGLHEGLISEGLLPRFTTIEYKGNRPPLNKDFRNVVPSFQLIDSLSTVCAHALMLNGQHKTIPCELSPEAQQMFDRFDKQCDNSINSSNMEIRRHLWNRAHIKALKLAALVAVGCNPYDPLITGEVASWSINIIVSDVKNLLDRFNAGEIGIDNDETKQLSKIIAKVKEYILMPWKDVKKYTGDNFASLHSNKIIPYAYLQRNLACIAVFKKDRLGGTTAIKRALTTLIERGDLQEVSRIDLTKNYGTQCRAFMVSNLKAFNL